MKILLGRESTRDTKESPPEITRIGSDAFRYRGDLRYIEIPSSITRIDDHAFYECRSLKSMIIPLIKMGESAFRGCYYLSSITILSSVSFIEKNYFHEFFFWLLFIELN